jgi:hypothetical protein
MKATINLSEQEVMELIRENVAEKFLGQDGVSITDAKAVLVNRGQYAEDGQIFDGVAVEVNFMD